MSRAVRLLLLGAAALISGCLGAGVAERGRTAGRGNLELGVGAGVASLGFGAAANAHYGVVESVDLVARVGAIVPYPDAAGHAELGAKWQLTPRGEPFAFSLLPMAGVSLTAAGAIPYARLALPFGHLDDDGHELAFAPHFTYFALLNSLGFGGSLNFFSPLMKGTSLVFSLSAGKTARLAPSGRIDLPFYGELGVGLLFGDRYARPEPQAPASAR